MQCEVQHICTTTTVTAAAAVTANTTPTPTPTTTTTFRTKYLGIAVMAKGQIYQISFWSPNQQCQNIAYKIQTSE